VKGPQSFVDNLANLALVMSVALEHVQYNRGEFLANAKEAHLRKFESTIREIRSHAECLEKEFHNLECGIGAARKAS
jgi:hypothetical protein